MSIPLKHKALDVLASGLISLLKRLSRETRQNVAHNLANLIFKLFKKTRNRAIDNVRRAFPDKTMHQATELAKRSYQNIVFGVFECFWLEDLEFEFDISPQTMALLASGKSLSVATMHMSCYEAVPSALQKITNRSTTLSDIPQFLTCAHKVYADIHCIDKNQTGAFLSLLQAIKRQRVVSLHSDLNDKAISLPFFGRKVGAPTGAAMLSAYGRTPLLLGYALLKSNGKYKICVETISERPIENNSQSIENAMADVYARFEKIISEHPEQWYWSYKRWR